MRDFIINYIPKESINIDESIFLEKKQIKESDLQRIRNLVTGKYGEKTGGSH